MKARILVVDDEPAIRDTMRMILEYEGHEVAAAGSGPEALGLVEREAPDLVFLDVKMPGLDGLEVLSRLRGLSDALPVVIISAHGTSTHMDALSHAWSEGALYNGHAATSVRSSTSVPRGPRSRTHVHAPASAGAE